MKKIERIPFVKMQGCGNDYIYIDCFDREINAPGPLSISLSDRHFGVGGDGVVLIGRPDSDGTDAKMRIFNLDGSEAQMCGNAIRCVAKYLYDNGIVPKLTMRVGTGSGIKEMRLTVRDSRVFRVAVGMGPAVLTPEKIPVALDGDRVVDRAVSIGGQDWRITCVSMGNPHCVVFCDDEAALDLSVLGPRFEHDKLFPERVNAEFVRVIGARALKARVWERGSGETLACGTGACAAAAAAVLNGRAPKGEDIRVVMNGGELTINYTEEDVWMTGAAEKAFEGVVEI